MHARQSGFGYRAQTGVNENYLGEIIGVGLLPAAAQLISSERLRWLRRIFVTLLLLTGVYALLLLASRGVFLAFTLALTVALLQRVRRLSTIIGAVVAIAIVAAMMTQLPGAGALLQRFDSTDVYTLNERTEVWTTVLNAIRDSSLSRVAFGYGFDSSAALVGAHSASLVSTHNTYLQVLYEFGVLGLLAFLSCHLYVFLCLAPRRDFGAVASASMLVFIMVCGVSGTESDTFQYWLVLGYAAATACTAAPSVSPHQITWRPVGVRQTAA